MIDETHAPDRRSWVPTAIGDTLHARAKRRGRAQISFGACRGLVLPG